MGKIALIFLAGFSVSIILSLNGFNSHLLHGLLGAFMGILTAPIIFNQNKENT